MSFLSQIKCGGVAFPMKMEHNQSEKWNTLFLLKRAESVSLEDAPWKKFSLVEVSYGWNVWTCVVHTTCLYSTRRFKFWKDKSSLGFKGQNINIRQNFYEIKRKKKFF